MNEAKQPSQEQVAKILRAISDFISRTEDELGDMSQEQKFSLHARMLGFWRYTEDICHPEGLSYKEFVKEFGPFVEGYISQEFNDEEPAQP